MDITSSVLRTGKLTAKTVYPSPHAASGLRAPRRFAPPQYWFGMFCCILGVQCILAFDGVSTAAVCAYPRSHGENRT
jgi:hypothetical protein